MPWYDLIKDPGVGNLNLRAFVASLLGPRRVAHGQRRVVQVPTQQGGLVANNKVTGHEAMYVEVWLPTQRVAAGARIMFASSEDMGENGVLRLFTTEEDHYQAVLLPNEQLYARIISDAGGNPVGDRNPLVVSTVAF